MFVIAKRLGTNEAEVYRYLNGEKMSRKDYAMLKKLWIDLVEKEKAAKKYNLSRI